jgi:galactokinase
MTELVPAGDPGAIATGLVQAFEERHGRRPGVLATAPGRVNLMGEHTDYNGGLCLPIALPHAAFVAADRRDDDLVSVTSLQQEDRFAAPLGSLRPESITGWAAYAAGVVWALREAGHDLPGVDLVVDSRVPLGAGLSSSAALECSVAVASCAVAGEALTEELRRRLIDPCMRAEREVAGAPTGGMDQTVALLGRAGHALRIDCGTGAADQVEWGLPPTAYRLLVIDTRSSHALGDGQYGSRRDECERAASLLGVEHLAQVTDAAAAVAALPDDVSRRRVRHILTEHHRVRLAVAAIEARDAQALGRLFDESHASMRDDFEISCPELDVAVDIATAAGALGARMTGGGFGGSAVALVPAERVGAVEAAVTVAFAEHGWAPPGFLAAEPSGGARLL